MVDTPFRLRVLRSMTAALQTVNRAASAATGPYTYDLTAAVFRGRAVFGSNDPLPMVSILEDPKRLNEDAVPEQSTAANGYWDLLVQGWVEDDPVNPTDPVYYLLADVKSALLAVRHKYNILGLGEKKPMVAEMLVGSGVIRPPDEISDKPYFWLPVRLRLVEDEGNAFT